MTGLEKKQYLRNWLKAQLIAALLSEQRRGSDIPQRAFDLAVDVVWLDKNHYGKVDGIVDRLIEDARA
tara:strand:- start:1154 stop:1357 length:204 start_codon:yes stop_codon:yes gene_type:complete